MYVLCEYALKLLFGFFWLFWDKVWLFFVITGWQPWSTLVSSSTVRWSRSSHHSSSGAFKKAVEQLVAVVDQKA